MSTIDKIEGKKIWTYLAIFGSIAAAAVLVMSAKQINESIKAAKDKDAVKAELEDVATDVVAELPEDQKSGCSGCSGADGEYRIPLKDDVIATSNWITR